MKRTHQASINRALDMGFALIILAAAFSSAFLIFTTLYKSVLTLIN